MVGHPKSLSAQYLFNDVAYTTASTIERTYVTCDIFYLDSRIVRAARAATFLHDFVVRYVVAHIEYFVGA